MTPRRVVWCLMLGLGIANVAQADDVNAAAVQALNADHSAAVAAMERLRDAGDAGREALVVGFDELSAVGRRRALRVGVDLASRDALALQWLGTLALGERITDDDRDWLLRAIADLGTDGADLLAGQVSNAPHGDRAAIVLAERFPERAATPVLHALAGDGSERPVLRRALYTAARRAPRESGAALRAWLDTNPSHAARAAAALALREIGPPEQISALLIGALDDDSFNTQWRLLQSAAHASPNADIDAWLQRTATEHPRWPLRAAAIDALSRHPSDSATATLRTTLKQDAHPRVRAAAAAGLHDDATATLALASAARTDDWHYVRVAAISSLAGRADARPILVAAVGDPSSSVRATAIRTLATESTTVGADAWPAVEARLQRLGEWPDVVRAAVRYAATTCEPRALAPLRTLISRAANPNDPDAMDLAQEAIAALGQIATGPAVDTLKELRNSAAPPVLKEAATRALQADTRCTPAKISPP